MGFESFRVELRGGNATAAEAEAILRHLAHARPDSDGIPLKGSTYFTVEDGRHVIELDLKDSPVRVSCRFTLCHPPSVDSAFLGLLRELMLRLGMEVWISDDVSPAGSQPYSLEGFPEFAAASRAIAARRAAWIAAFGDEPLAATTPDVHRLVILPRCRPGVEQPT